MVTPNPALQEYKESNIAGVVDYPDLGKRLEFWDSYLSYFSQLEDDSIPHAYFSEFDQGLYGGLMGASVSFLNDPDTGRITSMTAPLWDDLSPSESLKLPQPGELWYDRMINQFDTYANACKGSYLCSHFICVAAMNLLFELRGATNAFLHMINEPDDMNKVLEYSIDLNVLVQDAFFERVGLFDGGTASNMLQWAPGKVISESVDPFHLTGPKEFEQFGRKYLERMISHYDAAVIHLHANGYRLLPQISTIDNVCAIRLIDDPYNPRAIDQIDKLLPQSGGIPLVVQLPFERFTGLLKKNELPGNVFYRVLGVPTVDVANRTMEAVRDYKV